MIEIHSQQDDWLSLVIQAFFLILGYLKKKQCIYNDIYRGLPTPLIGIQERVGYVCGVKYKIFKGGRQGVKTMRGVAVLAPNG